MTLDANQSDSPKDVYFLGAGFSVFAGVPTFSNFRDKADKIMFEILSEYEPDKDYIPYMPEDIRIYERVFYRWTGNFNDYNIEEYYTAIEMSELLTNKKDERRVVTTNNIVKFIDFIIIKSLTNNIEIDRFYRKFLQYIENSDAGVITTNWDIILESSKRYENTLDFDTELGLKPDSSKLDDGSINYGSVDSYNVSLIL